MKEKQKKNHYFRFPLWAKTLIVLILSVLAVSIAAISFYSSTISAMTRNHYIEHSIELSDTLGVYLDLHEVEVVRDKTLEIYNNIPEEEKVENSYWGEPEWEAYLAKFASVIELPEYISLFKQIETFHNKNDAKFLCLCWADLTNNRFVYLVDDASEEERCLPGSFDDFTEEDMSIHEHIREGFTPEITNMPEYGYLASVARPIFDEDDEVAAFVLVDLSMDAIVAKEKENTKTLTIVLLSISLATVIIGSILVVILIARPLRILKKAANEYTKGNDQELNKFAKVKINTKDEIEDLSHSMQQMEKDINHYIVDLLSAQKKADEMKHLADRDALTGMFNKRAYFEMEEQINNQIKKGEAKYAITMIDLNDLKVINDNMGHEKGDEVIIVLAEAIKETYKNSYSYRVGGDEFVVVSFNEDLTNIENLRKELKKNALARNNHVSAAVGIAIFNKKLDNNFEDTFKRADVKMYQNKKDMKNK